MSALLHGNVDIAVVFFTPDAVVADWLGGAERLFGYTREEALGMPFSQLFTEADRSLGLDQQELALARSSGRSEDDRWHVRKSGGRFWASGVLLALRKGGVAGEGEVVALCKIVRDRTDVRIQMRALENQVAARTADIERRDRAAVSIAHELLNPIAPILSAIALLQKADDAATRARACEIIERQVGVLQGLIADLNHGAGPLSPHALIAVQSVDLNEALRESAEGLRASADAKKLALHLVLPVQTIWIAADPMRLQQMLLNLIGNAIKFTPAGGLITLSATVEGEMAVTRVEDNGRGISPDLIPHIFELFTREERADYVPGMGVGLAVVQDLARRHGGGVEARSAGVDLGSVFALRLPVLGPEQRRPAAAPGS